jgi:hypothetical protein
MYGLFVLPLSCLIAPDIGIACINPSWLHGCSCYRDFCYYPGVISLPYLIAPDIGISCITPTWLIAPDIENVVLPFAGWLLEM